MATDPLATTLSTIIADYENAIHANALVTLMNEYACHPMGGGKALDLEVQKKLPAALAAHPDAFSILVFKKNKAVGLANCFVGFSTFKCKPLVNIHDVIVSASTRGEGISTLLLDHIEQIAREKNCCKLTLEVLEGNIRAQKAYQKFGFDAYELKPEHGKALFWEKPL